MNTIQVTDQQLEYLADLVLEAYSNDVAEQKEWDEDSFEDLVDAVHTVFETLPDEQEVK